VPDLFLFYQSSLFPLVCFFFRFGVFLLLGSLSKFRFQTFPSFFYVTFFLCCPPSKRALHNPFPSPSTEWQGVASLRFPDFFARPYTLHWFFLSPLVSLPCFSFVVPCLTSFIAEFVSLAWSFVREVFFYIAPLLDASPKFSNLTRLKFSSAANPAMPYSQLPCFVVVNFRVFFESENFFSPLKDFNNLPQRLPSRLFGKVVSCPKSTLSPPPFPQGPQLNSFTSP